MPEENSRKLGKEIQDWVPLWFPFESLAKLMGMVLSPQTHLPVPSRSPSHLPVA